MSEEQQKNMIQLYYKKISKGGKPTYHKLTPDSSGAETVQITDRQAITIAASLLINVAFGVLDKMPKHRRVVREICNKVEEMVKLLKNVGEDVDKELQAHVADSWNLAMAIAELTDYERVVE